MISKKDIQEDIQWVNEFRNNAARAMGLRMKLVREKLGAIHLLEQDLQSKEGLALLKRTLKNERWFNRIIEKGLAESFGKLKEIYAWMRKNVRDKEAKNNTKKLVELVGYFYLKSKDIDKRLQLEEAFLERQDQKSFNRFLKEWEKDFKIRKKVINKIVGKGYIDSLREYFKKKSGFLYDASLGLAGGAVGSLVYNDVIKILGREALTKQEIGMAAAMFALTTSIVIVINRLIDLEERVYMDELVGLEQAARVSRIDARRAK